ISASAGLLGAMRLLPAQVACARDDEAAYRDSSDRYRTMTTSRGFDGVMECAQAMP
ncbi:MAG: hypothetical protein QOD97_3998, partial [Mycobacterium sp.]|nr:hypothetical protein [Mycobacterium sp.]